MNAKQEMKTSDADELVVLVGWTDNFLIHPTGSPFCLYVWKASLNYECGWSHVYNTACSSSDWRRNMCCCKYFMKVVWKIPNNKNNSKNKNNCSYLTDCIHYTAAWMFLHRSITLHLNAFILEKQVLTF